MTQSDTMLKGTIRNRISFVPILPIANIAVSLNSSLYRDIAQSPLKCHHLYFMNKISILLYCCYII